MRIDTKRPLNINAAIFELGQILGYAEMLKDSLTFIVAPEEDAARLRELIAASKRAAAALGVTIGDDEEES